MPQALGPSQVNSAPPCCRFRPPMSGLPMRKVESAVTPLMRVIPNSDSSSTDASSPRSTTPQYFLSESQWIEAQSENKE
jgi:hypothetical protein